MSESTQSDHAEQSEQPTPPRQRRWGPRRTLAAVAIAAGLTVTGGTAVALAADDPAAPQSGTTSDSETRETPTPDGSGLPPEPGEECDGLAPGGPPVLEGEPALPPEETQPDDAGSAGTPTLT
jgi:hypothetical protein